VFGGLPATLLVGFRAHCLILGSLHTPHAPALSDCRPARGDGAACHAASAARPLLWRRGETAIAVAYSPALRWSLSTARPRSPDPPRRRETHASRSWLHPAAELTPCSRPQDSVEGAIKDAKDACATGSTAECAAAWDVVEEVSAAKADDKTKAKARAKTAAGPASRCVSVALCAQRKQLTPWPRLSRAVLAVPAGCDRRSRTLWRHTARRHLTPTSAACTATDCALLDSSCPVG